MWNKDDLFFGIGLGLASVILSSLIVFVFLLVLNFTVAEHQRYFLLASLPTLFLFRFYLKKMQYHKTAKGLLVALVVLVIGFLIYLGSIGQLLVADNIL